MIIEPLGPPPWPARIQTLPLQGTSLNFLKSKELEMAELPVRQFLLFKERFDIARRLCSRISAVIRVFDPVSRSPQREGERSWVCFLSSHAQTLPQLLHPHRRPPAAPALELLVPSRKKESSLASHAPEDSCGLSWPLPPPPALPFCPRENRVTPHLNLLCL